jgi:hypothetical protein
VAGRRQEGLGKTGSYLAYRRLDFGPGVNTLALKGRGRSPKRYDTPVEIEVRLGSPDGAVLGSVALANSGHSGVKEFSGAIAETSGVQDIFLVNKTGPHWHLIEIVELRFEHK